ncbi:unnamed protein product [Arabis nemorensis]|uniref:Acidic protein n=1 Tax=Arabis nemorensis TaxID=586526 RepID=A0A565B8Q1_9BRAS|nr:unnamed protein product [Arabis nemorensis]
MEGKTVILSVLIMSLVMAQIQVEAKSCCTSLRARSIFNACQDPPQECAKASNCIIYSGETCPPDYPYDMLKYSGDGVNEYCKLGCTSSLCGAMTTLQKSDASEIVNGAVEQCVKACSTFCTKGSKIAVETA